jgi:hypothetical protein
MNSLPKILTPSRKDAKFCFALRFRVFALDFFGKQSPPFGQYHEFLIGLSLAPLVLHVTLPKDIGRMTSESPA